MAEPETQMHVLQIDVLLNVWTPAVSSVAVKPWGQGAS
jgi:hypothetical protein